MSKHGIFGPKYDTKEPIILTLIEAAKEDGNDLTDHVFSEIVQEYEADENEVMEQMAASKSPYFSRYQRGWHLHNLSTDEDE